MIKAGLLVASVTAAGIAAAVAPAMLASQPEMPRQEATDIEAPTPRAAIPRAPRLPRITVADTVRRVARPIFSDEPLRAANREEAERRRHERKLELETLRLNARAAERAAAREERRAERREMRREARDRNYSTTGK